MNEIINDISQLVELLLVADLAGPHKGWVEEQPLRSQQHANSNLGDHQN